MTPKRCCLATLAIAGAALLHSPASEARAGEPAINTAGPATDFSAARVVRRKAVVRGPRGNVAVRRTTWIRPGHYRWPPGGAIAAGAAIGFVAAATAAAWAGAAPGANLCWYYTSPAQTQGFWDVCP